MPKSKLLLLCVLSVIFFCSTSAIFLYFKTKERLANLQTAAAQQEVTQSQTSQIVTQLKKHILVPAEDPVIATVINADLLATKSAFYKHIQNRDEVVIFPEAKKAVIFRPSTNIIVNMGPLQFEDVATTDANLKPLLK